MLRNTHLIIFLLLFASFTQAQTPFQIQLAAFGDVQSDFVKKANQNGVDHVEELNDQNGLFRYVINGFRTRLEAEPILKQVKEKGYPYATIVDVAEQRALCGVPCPYFTSGFVFNSDANEGITVRTIYFDSGRNSLNLEARKELDQVAFIMTNNRQYNLKILGHTDAAGEATENMRVAAERARASRNYLISKGISAERLFIKVYGESMPIAPNKDESGNFIPKNQRLNRRVVLAIINKEEQVAKDSQINPQSPDHEILPSIKPR